MEREVSEHSNNKNFLISYRSEVPEVSTILPNVCQTKQKQDIKNKEIKKWKDRLNVDGYRMQKRCHYWEKYAPLVS